MQTEQLLKAPEAMALLQVKSSKFYQMQSRGLVTPPRHPTTNNPKRGIWRSSVLYELSCLQCAPWCTIIKSLDGTMPQ